MIIWFYPEIMHLVPTASSMVDYYYYLSPPCLLFLTTTTVFSFLPTSSLPSSLPPYVYPTTPILSRRTQRLERRYVCDPVEIVIFYYIVPGPSCQLPPLLPTCTTNEAESSFAQTSTTLIFDILDHELNFRTIHMAQSCCCCMKLTIVPHHE